MLFQAAELFSNHGEQIALQFIPVLYFLPSEFSQFHSSYLSIVPLHGCLGANRTMLMQQITIFPFLFQITGLAFSSINPNYFYVQALDYEVFASEYPNLWSKSFLLSTFNITFLFVSSFKYSAYYSIHKGHFHMWSCHFSLVLFLENWNSPAILFLILFCQLDIS